MRRRTDANKACTGRESHARAQASSGTAAFSNRVQRAGREIRDESVDAKIEQFVHFGRVVHGPNVHFEPEAMRERDTFSGDQRPILIAMRNLHSSAGRTTARGFGAGAGGGASDFGGSWYWVCGVMSPLCRSVGLLATRLSLELSEVACSAFLPQPAATMEERAKAIAGPMTEDGMSFRACIA